MFKNKFLVLLAVLLIANNCSAEKSIAAKKNSSEKKATYLPETSKGEQVFTDLVALGGASAAFYKLVSSCHAAKAAWDVAEQAYYEARPSFNEAITFSKFKDWLTNTKPKVDTHDLFEKFDAAEYSLAKKVYIYGIGAGCLVLVVSALVAKTYNDTGNYVQSKVSEMHATMHDEQVIDAQEQTELENN